jgi:hypothetical protein
VVVNSKKSLKGTRWFHNVDPDDLEGLDEYAEWLEALLHNPCSILDKDGRSIVIEIRQLVARLDGLKIEIYPNEHPPPHFHVRSPSVDAVFRIDDCCLLKGKVRSNDNKKILHWYQNARPLLIDAWNSSRPTFCTVGPFTAKKSAES